MLERKICKICGEEFPQLQARQTLCSDRCKRENKRRNAKETARKRRAKKAENDVYKTAKCPECGTEFTYNHTSQPNRRFCKTECGTLYTNRQYYRRKIPQNKYTQLDSGEIKDVYKTKKCPVCEKDFTYNHTSTPDKIHCSKECIKQKHRNKYAEEIGRNRFVIFERDSFKCIYCGKTTEEYETELTVDHIIAQANGGQDIAENLITSCKSCNSAKQDFPMSDESTEFICNVVKKRNEERNLKGFLKIRIDTP